MSPATPGSRAISCLAWAYLLTLRMIMSISGLPKAPKWGVHTEQSPHCLPSDTATWRCWCTCHSGAKNVIGAAFVSGPFNSRLHAERKAVIGPLFPLALPEHGTANRARRTARGNKTWEQKRTERTTTRSFRRGFGSSRDPCWVCDITLTALVFSWRRKDYSTNSNCYRIEINILICGITFASVLVCDAAGHCLLTLIFKGFKAGFNVITGHLWSRT